MRSMRSLFPYSSFVTPSIPTALSLSISSWHFFSSSLFIRCPIDVNTMSGFSRDSWDILSNFVSIDFPTPVYGQCFLFDIALHGRTAGNSPLSASLWRHCPPSLVLSVHPTACTPFVLLRQLSDIPYRHTLYGDMQALPS